MRIIPALAAVRHGNLYTIRPELLQRHTPRLLDGAQELCRILEEVRRKRVPDPGCFIDACLDDPKGAPSASR